MTPEPLPLPNPFELAAVYAASLGLFASGTLMAARLKSQALQTSPQTKD
ncbi:hypothetical protein ABI_05890 [Asticcacaulis biprosthecium C19]|uniref:Uncharacterized protein n=1 Tax=Asticcacaulis biprosthecium C19 TaxID=715226 RepID=F4QKK4_9CAUL|nr:hypothetical protein [Asticcacaulis biprosthecium]EGF92156.1 hypothetical protein ABI_05890 [Asticcacaulis biprosthecium C19]